MKKHYLLLILALFLCTMAFAQEWSFIYEYDRASDPVVRNTCKEAYEMSDGRVLVSGISIIRNDCGILLGNNTGYHPSIVALDSDGTVLHQATYLRDGYIGGDPYVLENDSGETFILYQYNPDHDTCSSNYFMNFSPPTDHSTLVLSRLNDDLSIAESFEWDIPIDTFLLDTTIHVMPGQISLFTAFVDSDGYIVGGYSKTVSNDVEPRGMDSTFFFKMDFGGNMVKLVGYETTHSGYWADTYYRYYHIVEADSLYLYYGWSGEVVDQQDRNLVYFDKDFNVVRTGRFRHSEQLPGLPTYYRDLFYEMNVIRSATGTTYMSCCADVQDIQLNKNYHICLLYEFDDGAAYYSTVPIKRYIERKTKRWDNVPLRKGVDVTSDNSIYFAYTLNVGVAENLDSWIMIEHLTPSFDNIETVYYDLPGEEMFCNASGITATEDGGALLTLKGKDLNQTNRRFEAVVKFPPEAFVGIEEAHDNGLKVAVAYPNPGGNTLNICTGLPNARVEVYDALGGPMHRQEITENETSINTETWPSGVYVWKVYSNGKEAESGKWVKE